MCIDYRKLELSSVQKAGFIILDLISAYFLGSLFFDNIKISIIIFISLFSLLPVYKRKLMDKRRKNLLVQFRDMLYSISSSISAGRNMHQALKESIEFWEGTYSEKDYIMIELKYMLSRIESGNDKDTIVLKDFAERSDLEDVSDFVNVYFNTKTMGGDLPGAIERATTIIGEKISLEDELRTLMSQKIVEGRIVAASPFLVVCAMRIFAPDYLLPLTQDAKGQAVMGLALGLMLIALLIIEKINKIEI